MIGIVLAAAVGYFAGSIPFSLIAGRVFGGIDLREHGSGNLGATNTFRYLGAKIAIGVLVLDIAKGFLPVYFAPTYAAGHGVADHWLMIAATFAAVFGHMFSVWVRFRGGKGIATTAGAFMALAPWAFLIAAAVFFAAVGATRIVSVGSISAAVALPVAVWVVDRVGLADTHRSVLAMTVALSVVVLVKHKSNIARLRTGREPVLQRHKR